MFKWLFFGIGLVINLFLIVVFYLSITKNQSVLEKIGPYFFLLIIPALYCIFLVIKDGTSTRHLIFLIIFLVFMFIEWLFDYVLKIDFRSFNDWRTFVPYIVLYYAMNYGFVVMTWKYLDVRLGIGLMVLWVIQLGMNIFSHF